MPNYTRNGKILTPITEEEFKKGMDTGHFCQHWHRAFPVLLFYTGVRRWEAARALKEQFQITKTHILFDVGDRQKHSKTTPPLPIPLKAPYVCELQDLIEKTKPGQKIFPSRARGAKEGGKMGYRIILRAFNRYPHYFRLSRITWFFMSHPEIGRPQGFSIAEVKNWTGLTVNALDYYVGLVTLQKMGDALLPGS